MAHGVTETRQVMEYKQLTNRQKAAIVLVSIGPELGARILKRLKPEHVEVLMAEAANVGYVSPDVRERVLKEFKDILSADAVLDFGGVDFVREVLERALGQEKAGELMRKLVGPVHVKPLSVARRADPAQLTSFLEEEHPQTVALVLSYLDPPQAGRVLSSLPPEKQVAVAKRLALMEKAMPEIVSQVESVLERRLSSVTLEEQTTSGGIEAVVKVLGEVDRSTERTILTALEKEDPVLAEAIKKHIFVFEDIVNLHDKDLQRVLREVEVLKELPMALKTASESVKAKIFRNVSKRAAQTIEEEMEYLGAVRVREVEEAQQKIVGIIRRLDDEGEIYIARGGEDEVVA